MSSPFSGSCTRFVRCAPTPFVRAATSLSRRDEATGEVALCDHRSDWPTGHLQQPRRLVARLADPLLDELRVDAYEIVSERLVHEEHHLLALAVEVVSGSEGVFVYEGVFV